MTVLHWLINRLCGRDDAQSHYRRGMARAKKHNHEGAIAEYTTTIDMSDTSAEMKAMALYHRALAHVAAGDERKGIDDLDAVVAMGETIVNAKTMARQKLAAWESRHGTSKV